MAKKAKSHQKHLPSPAQSSKESSVILRLSKSGLLAVSLALSSISIQLALRPLYGGTPPALNHSYIKLAASLSSILIPMEFSRTSLQIISTSLAIWLAYAPYSSYTLAKWSAQWGNPVLGASATEALILFPALSLGISLLREWNGASLPFLPGPLSVKTASALGLFKLVDLTENWLWPRLPFGGMVYSSNIFFLASLCLTICAALGTAAGGRYQYARFFCLGLPLVVMATSMSLPPTSTPSFPMVHSTLPVGDSGHSSISVLARSYSVTGLILVGEHIEEQFRFLRADHSILGGRWIGQKVPANSNGIGDSIYSTFVLQEAIRLIERTKNHTGEEHALFIGLGVGVAAESFISHGINTTIVEVDPLVYQYAREYFHLPEPHAVYLEDARAWVDDPVKKTSFDYIVHDCFSGGGVPQHIYTVEFWQSLKRIMKPDGIVAVNFAGRLATEPARAILLTLQHAFPKCRAYHDHQEAEFDESYSFFNIVIFCVLSPNAPLEFRKAVAADYHGSYLRAHMFNNLKKRELSARTILGLDKEPDLFKKGVGKWVLRDKENPLAKWQQIDAVEHWKVMRGVLPDLFWEAY